MRRRGSTPLLIAAALAVVLVVVAAQAATRPNAVTPPPGTTTTPEEAPLPRSDARLPRGPRTLAARLTASIDGLGPAVSRWRREGDLAARPPVAVARLATDEARIVALLAARPGLRRQVLRRLPARVVRRVAPEVRALGDLHALHRISQRRPGPPPKVRIGPPPPLAELQDHYATARRRFGVGVHVLAAIHHVETKFGRYRNESISGARGPMQFMPATWRAYGLGGDVRDPRDAILGAANYLRASGAPRDNRRAIHAYNPSELYVRTVRLYANRIARHPDWLPALYARDVVGSG